CRNQGAFRGSRGGAAGEDGGGGREACCRDGCLDAVHDQAPLAVPFGSVARFGGVSVVQGGNIGAMRAPRRHGAGELRIASDRGARAPIGGRVAGDADPDRIPRLMPRVPTLIACLRVAALWLLTLAVVVGPAGLGVSVAVGASSKRARKSVV